MNTETARRVSRKLLTAAIAFVGPVAGAVKEGLNDAEKTKVLIKILSTYTLTWGGIQAAAHETDLLIQWAVPLAPALFAGTWEALSRLAQGVEKEAETLAKDAETVVSKIEDAAALPPTEAKS